MKCFYFLKHIKEFKSHPVRGAWIEIAASFAARVYPAVAPREGCVD